MRTHQISASINRLPKEDKIAEKCKCVSVYADANDFYEALCAAYNETVMEIQRVGGFEEMTEEEKEVCANEMEVVFSIAYSELLHPVFYKSIYFGAISENVYEALTLAFNKVLYEVQKIVDLPTFGRKEHYGDPSGKQKTVLDFQFVNAEDLTGPDITIPGGYLHIMPHVFRGCEDIESIIIPEGITKIEMGAFENCVNLKSVSLPESIMSISSYVFEGCKSLTHIELPAKVDTLYSRTFHGCESLREVTLPEGIKKIYGAFEYCTSLKVIRTPASVNEISNDAFKGCCALENIFVDKGNTEYSDIDGVLFNKDGTVLLRYPEGKNPEWTGGVYGFYDVPKGVQEIGHDAFSGCRHIAILDIPASLTKISHVAFRTDKGISYNGEEPEYRQNYDSIREFLVDPKNEVYSTLLDGVLFSKDTKVLIKYPKGHLRKEYILPDGTTEILHDAFADCINLETVVLPKSLTQIGGFAFQDCTGLTHITIPENVQEIERGCFWGCSKLTDVLIRRCDVKIEDDAFEGAKCRLFCNEGSSAQAYAEKHGTLYYTAESAFANFSDEEIAHLTSKFLCKGE